MLTKEHLTFLLAHCLIVLFFFLLVFFNCSVKPPFAETDGKVIKFNQRPRAIVFKNKELFVNVLHILIGQAKKSPPRKAPPIPAQSRKKGK